MDKKHIFGAVAGLLAAIIVNAVILGFSGGSLGATWAGGTSHTNSQFDAVGGFSVNGTAVITSSSLAVATVSSTVTSPSLTLNGAPNSGTSTAITKYGCNTATIATTTNLTGTPAPGATTTDITLTGSVVGDQCTGSLTSATTTKIQVTCNIAANGTGTLQVVNYTGASSTLGAGTGKVCFTH